MGASSAANTAANRLVWAFFCLVGHKMAIRGGKRCTPVLVAKWQQPEDEPDGVDAPPPLLLGDMETGSIDNDYNRSNSGGDERIRLAENDDSALDEQPARQLAAIGNDVPEYAGLQLGEDTENGDEDNEVEVGMTGMMRP